MQDSITLLSLVLQVCVSVLALDITLHRSCQLHCTQEVLGGKYESYDQCMQRCFTEGGGIWMFQRETGSCDISEHNPGAMPACPARSANIVSCNKTIEGEFDIIHEYVIVEWTPCPFGLHDVKGYEVRLREVNLHQYDYCKQVYLKKKLDLNALNSSFSVLFKNQELNYGKKYSITIEGLPKTTHRSYYPVEYVAKSCEELNGPGSCECGLESVHHAPEAKATILGYMVTVIVPKLKSCFNVYLYNLVIIRTSGAKKVTIVEKASISSAGGVFYNFSVHPIESSSNSSLYFQYRAIAYGGKSLPSNSLPLNISYWKPNIPTPVGKSGHIILSWDCASAYFNISQYELQLNWYGLHGLKGIRHQSNHTFQSNCSSNGKMTVEISVRSGIYSAKVRELYPSAPWSSSSERTEVITDGAVTFVDKNKLIVAVSVVLPITILIVSILVTCYCLRKGRCKKIQHRIPSPFPHLISHRTAFEHHCYTVWIVWQADNRSSAHKDLHAANIRHLAAFLTNCCGLTVILDQYEVPLVTSVTSWLQEKQREAKFVLFICPHTAPPHHTEAISGIVGNFSIVFRLFQAALLHEDTAVQFATMLLPYSDPNCSDAMKLLLSTTPTFRLMEDIESFYFFVQGLRKSGPFGRHVVKFVNKREYAETREGLMLKNGMEEMVLIAQTDALNHDENSQFHLPPTLSDAHKFSLQLPQPDQAYTSTVLSLISSKRDVGENRLNPVLEPPPLKDAMLEKKSSGLCLPIPPPPIIQEEDPEQSVLMINSGGELLSFQPFESEPVDTVAVDSWSPLLPSDMSVQVCGPDGFGWLSHSQSIGTCSTGFGS